MTSTYRCPVCKKPLTKQEYERATGIIEEREKHLKHVEEELKKKLLEAKSKARKAKEEGIKAEREHISRVYRKKAIELVTEQFLSIVNNGR